MIPEKLKQAMKKAAQENPIIKKILGKPKLKRTDFKQTVSALDEQARTSIENGVTEGDRKEIFGALGSLCNLAIDTKKTDEGEEKNPTFVMFTHLLENLSSILRNPEKHKVAIQTFNEDRKALHSRSTVNNQKILDGIKALIYYLGNDIKLAVTYLGKAGYPVKKVSPPTPPPSRENDDLDADEAKQSGSDKAGVWRLPPEDARQLRAGEPTPSAGEQFRIPPPPDREPPKVPVELGEPTGITTGKRNGKVVDAVVDVLERANSPDLNRAAALKLREEFQRKIAAINANLDNLPEQQKQVAINEILALENELKQADQKLKNR